MSPKDIKTVQVPKSDYRIFLNRADEFHYTMQKAAQGEKWAAVGLNAVHCAISCCDALLTYYMGVRSIGDDHIQATELLQRLPNEVEDGQAANYRRIIAKKNLIAYENREFRSVDALEIMKMLDRFYNAAIKKLPKI
jgi:hypothetical protein